MRHQSDWSKVSLYPSPSFLFKNQLAKDCPDSVASVDSSASDLRQHKELVFVSFKKGFNNDISSVTISSWIKQTVVLCYELSDKGPSPFAVSKTFKYGVSLEQLFIYQPVVGSHMTPSHNFILRMLLGLIQSICIVFPLYLCSQ